MVAAFLGTGELHMLAQGVEQRSAGVQFELVRLAVDFERDGCGNGPLRGAAGGFLSICHRGHGDAGGGGGADLQQVSPCDLDIADVFHAFGSLSGRFP
ncbi:hypothetical protein D3C72_2005110 [compost metagenome]